MTVADLIGMLILLPILLPIILLGWPILVPAVIIAEMWHQYKKVKQNR